MENQALPIIIKQEPPDEEKNMVVEVSEVGMTDQLENSTEPHPLKIQKGGKKSPSTEKLLDAKRIKKEPQPFPVNEEKVKKVPDAEMEPCIEPPRSGVFPYRTKSDFCCTICNAHMNSIQMWESHIRGKRHLKNCKKGSVTVAAAAAAPAPVPVKKEKLDDVAGLYYIDTQGAQSPPHDTVIYERGAESPGDTKTNPLRQKTRGKLRNLKGTEDGSYQQSFCLETELHVNSVVEQTVEAEEGFITTSREYQSPEAASPSVGATSNLESLGLNNLNMTMTERINYILKLSTSIHPQSESDFNEIKSILAALTQSILQYEIRQLPLAAQQKLAKELFRGN